MWLVLCSPGDSPALWAHEGLKARGLAPLELVSVEALGYRTHWVHRIGADGACVEIVLSDGRTIRSERVRGVLNRLVGVPTEHLPLVHPADRDYMMQELTAFFMSWLNALPGPVLNPPTPQGLSGYWRHASEWALLAAQAGLSTPTYRQTSRDGAQFGAATLAPPGGTTTVIVVERHAVGPAPRAVLSGCRRLAELAQTPLLGVQLAAGSGGPWTFAAATPLPDLRLGGEAVLDALAAALKEAPAR